MKNIFQAIVLVSIAAAAVVAAAVSHQKAYQTCRHEWEMNNGKATATDTFIRSTNFLSHLK